MAEDPISPPIEVPETPIDPQVIPSEPEVITPPPTPDPVVEVPTPIPPQPPPAPPVEFKPVLYFPFLGSFEVSFGFGSKPLDDVMQQKYQDWGLIGHNGIDYALPEGTEVLACDFGKVIQSGDNGDYGNSVTLQHSWGTSIYGHLKETKVAIDQEIKTSDLLGISGQTGYVTGPHLHFGIKPNDVNLNNGYLGFVDPFPYLSPLPQSPFPADLSAEASAKVEVPVQVDIPPEPQIIEKIVEKKAIREVPVEKEVIKEVIKDISEEKFRARVVENQSLGNLAKKAKHDGNLNRIMQVAQEKKTISNSEVRELLHVFQSTATNYLNTLADRGMLKVDKKAKATIYTY